MVPNGALFNPRCVVSKRRNEKMDCVFGTPKQQNEGLIKKSPVPNCLKVDEKEEVLSAMVDDEDGARKRTRDEIFFEGHCGSGNLCGDNYCSC